MTDFKVLSDEEIAAVLGLEYKYLIQDVLGRLSYIAGAQFQYTIQQVVEMLDGIENPYPVYFKRGIPYYAFDMAIQTIKARLEEE